MLALSGYSGLEALHRGTRSLLLRGRRNSDGTSVIVKTPAVEFPSATDLRRLRREFALGERVAHGPARAHVVRHYALEPMGPSLGLVLEDFEAVSLTDCMAGAPLPLASFLELGLSLTRAVQALHESSIAHLDINPDNVLYQPETRALRLCDLSSAVVLGHGTEPVRSFRGTPAYAAPETTLRTDWSIDGRADLYSLGVTFFQLLTGSLPFQNGDPLEVFHRHLAVAPPSPCSLRPDLPTAVAGIVLRLLSKMPDERYQGAIGLATDLETCRTRLLATGDIGTLAIGRNDPSTRFQIPNKVYGREQEVAELLRAFHQASQGKKSFAILSGEAGSGKSTVVAQLREPVVATGGRYCRGKFEPIDNNAPYVAFSAALRELAHSLLARPSAELGRWRERLLAALGPNGQHLLQLAPELQALIGAQPPAPVLEPDQAQTIFRHVIVESLVALTSPERPLLLFLDDVQWADLASLALAEELVADERFAHVMLICSYRKHELVVGNELHELFRAMLDSGSLLELEVSMLAQAQIESLLTDATGQEVESLRPLATLIGKKTRGNPFFVRQFLKMLHSEGLLHFDVASQRWQYDEAECRAQYSTDNVIDLMVRRIHRLNSGAQQVLRYAACFTGEFDPVALARVIGNDRDQVELALAEAVATDLVSPVAGEAAPNRDSKAYRFQHDQVRQAVYSLIAADERAPLHLAVGRHLLACCPPDARAEQIFKVLQQFMQCLERVTDAVERRQLAELCLLAGQRAKAANAYTAAREYLEAGVELLTVDGWEHAYPLMLALHQEHAEASYLGGNLAEMEADCVTVLEHSRSLLDRLPAQQLRLIAHNAQNDLPGVINLARSVLGSLGIHLPQQPGQLTVALRVARMALRLRNENADSLLARPLMEDPQRLAAMQIMAQVVTPFYLTSPKLFPLLICEMLTLTLAHGNTAWAADALIGWGAIQIAGFGDVKRGHAVGSAAPRLVEATGATARRGRTQTNYALLIRHWMEPLRAIIEPLRQSVRHALDHGDLSYASVAAVTRVYYMLMAGCPLDEVAEASLEYDRLLSRHGQERFRRDNLRTLQLVRCLQGNAEDPKRLSGEHFDDEASLRRSEQEGDRAALASLHCERALLRYVYGDMPGSLESCDLSGRYIDSVLAMIYAPLLSFLSALVRLRLMSTDADSRHGKLGLGKIRQSLRRLEKWAAVAPTNHAHRAHLVRAELCRVGGEELKAAREYDRAIELAGQNGYLHEQAIALEAAGRFYASTGRGRVAALTLLAARNAWLAWGAKLKASQLEREFAELLTGNRLLSLSLPPSPQQPLREAAPAALDVESVVKASQAIVGEIRLPNLVRRLLALAMENTGAQRGFLLLHHEGQMSIEAEADMDRPSQSHRLGQQRTLGELQGVLPAAIIEYVARTKEPLVLLDASAEALFLHDTYINTRRPLSVLCLPLVAQGKLSGLVYLENNRMRGAFTTERLEVLRVLSALAAISLDNSRLYEDVAQAHAWQLRVTEAQARFVPAEFLRSLQRASIVDVVLGDSIRKEMSILFSDVRGFTSLVEGMPTHEHVGFINGYLGHMEPAIVQNGGFVDSYLGDGILALFEGDPDNALRAAIGMSSELARFNAERVRAGRAPIEMGVGISAGPLTLGTIGGPGRIKCGVIGDPVNLASRIESFTRRSRSFLLISEQARERLLAPHAFELRGIGRVRVKGMHAPNALYEVLDAEPPARRDAKRRSLRHFDAGMSAYTIGSFAEGRRLFEACLESCPEDGAARHLAERCRELELRPPASWDGVEVLTEK